MLLKASFDELNGIITDKAGVKGLSLGYVTPDTASVSYLLNLGVCTPKISAKVKVVSIEGSRITAMIDAGNVGDFVLDKAKKLLLKKTPEGLIESFDDKVIVVNLEAIPDLKSVFDTLAVNGLSFEEDNILLDANLK